MVELVPYDDQLASFVLQNLDGNDLLETAVVRGIAPTGLALFADWRSMNPHRVVSLVAIGGELSQPFAVFGLSNTGAYGVAEAAFLARDHEKNARDIMALAREIKKQIAQFSLDLGIRRIEARCSEQHPTASRFLRFIGFQSEAVLAGFGANGDQNLIQFSYTQRG